MNNVVRSGETTIPRGDQIDATPSAETGVHVELVVDAQDACRIADYSKRYKTSVESTSRTVVDESRVVEEFVVADGFEGEPDRVEQVFESDSRSVYRFERTETGCICDLMGEHGVPVNDVFARNGNLHITCYIDQRSISDVVDLLKSNFGTVDVRRLVASEGRGDSNPILVDRDQLSEQQHKVLETALTNGYFDHPREASATELADELGISISTFTEHLARAEAKVFGMLFEGR